MVHGEGLEPPTFGSKARRATSCAIRDWQDEEDSNPQPTILETVALPIELSSYGATGMDTIPRPALYKRAALPLSYGGIFVVYHTVV